MTVSDLLREVHRRDRWLSATGRINAGLLAVMLIVAPFADRTVMGINPWIKPMKFAASITIYVWTIAWLFHHARISGWMRRLISGGISIAMLTEIACIALQAARGTTSHYNASTPLDVAIFQTMGLMILVNTVFAATVAVLAFVRMDLPPAYLWGVRLGLAIFVIGSLEGALMIAGGAHTVGAPDGGPGLPFINWSTRAGDLRVAHVLGLHALQVLPLAGWLAHRASATAARGVAFVFGFAALYAAAFAATLSLALRGRPLLAL